MCKVGTAWPRFTKTIYQRRNEAKLTMLVGESAVESDEGHGEGRGGTTNGKGSDLAQRDFI